MEEPVPFRILAVCTGNVCRSPLVERLLQAEFDRSSPGGFHVRSAGVQALVGRGMTPEISSFVRKLGGSDTGFFSRQLTGQILADQDLVLALTRAHRAKVLEIAPKMLRRTFTLREFERMVRFVTMTSTPTDFSSSTNSYDRWNQLLPAAASVRHQILDDPGADDVVDPFRRDVSVHQEMLAQIMPTLEALTEFESTAARV